MGDLRAKIGLTPVGIGNEYGVDTRCEVLDILGRSAVVPNVGIRGYTSKDGQVDGSCVLGKAEHVGIHGYHGERCSGLGYVGGIGSNTSHGIGNGVGVGTGDQVKDVLGSSPVGPSIGERWVGSGDGNLYGPVASSKAGYVRNDGSYHGTLWRLVNGKGIGD